MITYLYKVTRIQDNKVIGTGRMTSGRILNESEQLNLMHEMTHKIYLSQYYTIKITLN
jgi:hypothetical protein